MRLMMVVVLDTCPDDANVTWRLYGKLQCVAYLHKESVTRLGLPTPLTNQPASAAISNISCFMFVFHVHDYHSQRSVRVPDTHILNVLILILFMQTEQ